VAAARAAFADSDWSRMTPGDRERLLHRLADLVEQNGQTVGEIETIDNGKAITGCLEADVGGSVELLHYMAGWATKIEGATRSVSTPGQHFAYTLKEPVGVVGAIVPWNWPFNMAMWKIAAPLAAGCTIVVKPAQQTSLSLLYFMHLCEQAGIPKGVLNVVTGKGSVIGQHLAGHPGVDKVSFTGSTGVGRIVGKAAMEHIAHVTLELGGKSPMVVFEDADIERVVNATQASIFFNTGQVCSAGSRMYVHRDIYEDVVQAVAERASAMKLAPGLDPETEMGPVISKEQYDSIGNYLKLGREEGAEVVCGGEVLDRPGYFIQPTVLGRTDNRMRIVQEEIFGPVLVAQAFSDEDEALRLANDNEYGLASSVFTRDISRAHRVVRRIEAGTVWVNTHDLIEGCMPFGGYKHSGIGKDLGPEQLDHFLETKAVWLEL
jgi:phenylacetaldehyde dehydrogenase